MESIIFLGTPKIIFLNKVMKRFNFFKLTLKMLIFSCFFIACGGEEDTPGNTDKEENGTGNGSQVQKDEITGEQRLFVGMWDRSSGYNYPYHWVFFADGTCIGSFSNGSKPDGEWTYDTATKILATTVNGWQYTVTLASENAWAGISLGSKPKSIFFDKSPDWQGFYSNMVTHYNWTASDGTLFRLLSTSDGYRVYEIKKGEDILEQGYAEFGSISPQYEMKVTTYKDLDNFGYQKTGTFTIILSKPYQKVPTLKMKDVTYVASSVN